LFSLKTLRVRPRKILVVCTLVAAFLLLVELAFRKWDWFYDYEGWESPGLLQKMADAEKLSEEKGRIDLVVLSTSVGRVWDVRQWEEATSSRIVAYNFGFPDQRPERQNFLFQKYIYPKFQPTHLIYGVAVTDLNSNGRGKHPDRPRDGPFWTYRNIKEMRAESLKEKISAWLSEKSILFRSRARARFTLQYGPIAMLQRDPTIGRGVIAPTIIRQEYGPQPPSWALEPLGILYNTYWDYWAPDDGEIGEIADLAAFCRRNGVKFTVVEIPTSPYGHTNFNVVDGYNYFLQTLFLLIDREDVMVLPMGRDLKLDNTYFEDQDHLNRWGADIITNYVYQHVIRKWFPESAKAEALPTPVEISLYKQVDERNQSAKIERLQPATLTAEYAAEMQIVVTEPTDIQLTSSLTPGSYAVEIYAGDGTTTAPELTGEAELCLTVLDGKGEVVVTMPLIWINSRIGVSYTQSYISVPTTGALSLQITSIKDRPVILDSAFIRPRLSNLGESVIVEE